jgi:hypothetical protein
VKRKYFYFSHPCCYNFWGPIRENENAHIYLVCFPNICWHWGLKKLCVINQIRNIYTYNIRTLSVNIKFICTSFRNRQNSEPSVSFSGLFPSEYTWILYLTTMYVYCVYPAMSKKSEHLSDLNKKDRKKRHSSPFINVVNVVFFVVRVTLVPVSYLSAPSAVHSYGVPGKFIRRLKTLFVGWKVYSSSTNKAKIYSYSIFVQQMYWLQDKYIYIPKQK